MSLQKKILLVNVLDVAEMQTGLFVVEKNDVEHIVSTKIQVWLSISQVRTFIL